MSGGVASGGYEVERTHQVTVVDNIDVYACCRYCQTELENREADRQHLCPGRDSRDFAEIDAPEPTSPTTHEMSWRFTFEDVDEYHGAAERMYGYRAIVSQFDEALHDRVNRFEACGDEWQIITSDTVENDDRLDEDATGDDAPATTNYWTGKIATLPGDDFEAYNEYQIAIRADDETFQRKASIQFRPSYPGMKHSESGERMKSVPADLPPGVRVEFYTSNIEPDEYFEVLQSLVDAIGISPRHFTEDQLDRGSCSSLGRYVRLHRSFGESLVSQGNVMFRLAELSSSAEGTNGKLEWDNEQVKGSMQVYAENPTGWGKVLPSQRYGKYAKYYHPKYARGVESEDVLSSPKVELQFSPSLSDGYIDWEERDRAIEELDEALLNVLHWGGVPLGDDVDGVFRDDDPYFDTEKTTDVSLYPDPTEGIRQTEQDMAYAQLVDVDLSPSQERVVELVTNGGPRHYEDLAEQAETSVSTVYRTLEKAEHVLDSQNGSIGFVDGAVRDRVERLFATVQDYGARISGELENFKRSAKALEFEGSAFARWKHAHSAVIQEAGERWEIDLSNVERPWNQIRRLLRSGYVAAMASGLDSRQFIKGQVRYRSEDGAERQGTVDEFVGRHKLEDVLTWRDAFPARG